jgi:hypothetical protein
MAYSFLECIQKIRVPLLISASSEIASGTADRPAVRLILSVHASASDCQIHHVLCVLTGHRIERKPMDNLPYRRLTVF